MTVDDTDIGVAFEVEGEHVRVDCQTIGTDFFGYLAGLNIVHEIVVFIVAIVVLIVTTIAKATTSGWGYIKRPIRSSPSETEEIGIAIHLGCDTS